MALLAGKTAVITGGTSGIGLATAHRFIAEGATVFIFGRRQTELDKAVADLGEAATGVQGDVTDIADLDRLYAAVAATGRPLDIVFANAGVNALATLSELTAEHFDRLFDINVKGLAFTVQKALPLLPDGASIILNSSVASETGRAGSGVYSASKAAIRSFARTWANELSPRKIRVNAVLPATTDTPAIDSFAAEVAPGADVEQFKTQRGSTVPLGRLAHAVEVANTVVFLASDLSSFTTGAALPVDGGINQI
ncbi:MAG: SDR family oxidoreductase [Mycobacterium sp.]